MGAITRQMLEGLSMPKDTIREEDGNIIAEIDHFEMQNGVLVPIRSDFSKKIGDALSPFLYLKPDVSQGDLLSPETKWEDNPREGYQVIGKVDNSARMANHVDALRNALIMAIEKDGEWETRYFPEGNVTEDTWKEAMQLLS